jgi:hypothetical protein
MNQTDFEKQLRADGFTEVEFQKLAPVPAKGGTGTFSAANFRTRAAKPVD